MTAMTCQFVYERHVSKKYLKLKFYASDRLYILPRHCDNVLGQVKQLPKRNIAF